MSDGIWAKVTGTAGRIFNTKNGTGMAVEVTRPNSQYPDRVTVWDAFDFQTGDPVVVEGWLSWRKSERDGKTYWDVSLNSPRVAGTSPERPQEPAGRDNNASGYEAPAWQPTGAYDPNLPF